MPEPKSKPTTTSPHFPPTRWSLVLDVQNRDSKQHRRALDELCRTYWFPLYAFIRRSGISHEDAEDLVQEFLSRILQRWLLDDVSAEKGKLRSWLLAVLKPFLTDHYRHQNALKRGGGAQIISIDSDDADLRYREGLDESTSPETAFEKRWAVSVFAAALDALEAEYATAGKADLFKHLAPHLQWQGDDNQSYADCAAKLAMTEGGVRVAVYRLRRRFRETLRTEVGHTLGPGENIDEELRHLLTIIAT